MKRRIGVVGTRGIPDVPGGVETHCAELYPRLAAAGFDVTVYAREKYVPGSGMWRGVRIVALSSPGGKGVETLVHSWRGVLAAHRDGCDVVHVHSVGSGWVIPLVRLLGMRSVFTVHGPDYLQRKWGRSARLYLRLGEGVGMRWSDEVITVSDHQRESLEQRYRRRVHCLENGAPEVAACPPGPLLESLGFEGDDYVLFVGRLIPDKCVEDLIAAVHQLPARIRLIVVGDSADTDWYAERLKQQADERVIFAGSRRRWELAELQSNARVFVLPSAIEGLPVSLLEALAYGVAAVGSDIGANREVLDCGRAGRLFPLGDVTTLAATILQLWDDDEDRHRLSAAGRAQATQRFSWDRIAQETCSVFASVLSRNLPTPWGARLFRPGHPGALKRLLAVAHDDGCEHRHRADRAESDQGSSLGQEAHGEGVSEVAGARRGR